MTDKSHLWYPVKLPLLFLHLDDTFTLKRLPTPSITQPLSLIGQWWLFVLSTLSCAFSLKGKGNQRLDRGFLTGLGDPTLSVFESRAKCYPSFELGEFFYFVLVYRARRCHHWLPPPQHRPQVCFPLSLSLSPSLHLLDRQENIFYHYNDPNSDIGYVCFGMWVLHPSYPLFAHLFT